MAGIIAAEKKKRESGLIRTHKTEEEAITVDFIRMDL